MQRHQLQRGVAGVLGAEGRRRGGGTPAAAPRPRHRRQRSAHNARNARGRVGAELAARGA
jgi:hypothetical protein